MWPHIRYLLTTRAEGKTTWLADVCFKTAKYNKVKALYLDTEMTTKEIRFRMAAAISECLAGIWRQVNGGRMKTFING